MGWVAPRCIRGGISRRIRTHGPSVRRCTTSDVPAAFTGPRAGGSGAALGTKSLDLVRLIRPSRSVHRQRIVHWLPLLSRSIAGRIGRVVKVILPGVKATRTSQKQYDFIAIGWDEREAEVVALVSLSLSWYLGTRAPGVRQRNLRQFPELEALSQKRRVMEGIKNETWKL